LEVSRKQNEEKGGRPSTSKKKPSQPASLVWTKKKKRKRKNIILKRKTSSPGSWVDTKSGRGDAGGGCSKKGDPSKERPHRKENGGLWEKKKYASEKTVGLRPAPWVKGTLEGKRVPAQRCRLSRKARRTPARVASERPKTKSLRRKKKRITKTKERAQSEKKKKTRPTERKIPVVGKTSGSSPRTSKRKSKPST